MEDLKKGVYLLRGIPSDLKVESFDQEKKEAIFSFSVRQNVTNVKGGLFGGSTASLVVGLAVESQIAFTKNVVLSTDVSIRESSYSRAALAGSEVKAIVKSLHSGRKFVVSEVKLINLEKKLIAIGRHSGIVLSQPMSSLPFEVPEMEKEIEQRENGVARGFPKWYSREEGGKWKVKKVFENECRLLEEWYETMLFEGGVSVQCKKFCLKSGENVCEFVVPPRTLYRSGVFDEGMMASLVDALTSSVTSISSNRTSVTTDINLSYIKQVKVGTRITVTVTPLTMGSTFQMIQIVFSDQEGPIAVGRHSKMVLDFQPKL